MHKISIRTITYMGILVAMEIVLSRFLSINAWNIKIGFNFVPVVIGAIVLGPVYGGLVGALGDFLGAVLFPIGPYFPGFTLTAFLTGLVFGLCLHKQQTHLRTLIAVGVNQLILGLFLNSFWISTLYKSPFVPLLTTRIFQCALLTVVEFAVISLISRALTAFGKRAFA